MLNSNKKFEQWRAAMRPALPEAWQRLVDTIIRAAEEVQGVLGPGLAADVYEVAMGHELPLRGLAVERRSVSLTYKGVELPVQELSLVVNGLAVVDIRVGEAADAYYAQQAGRLRAADLPLGLLINFGAVQVRHGVYRSVNRVATAALGLFPPIEGAPTEPIRFPGA